MNRRFRSARIWALGLCALLLGHALRADIIPVDRITDWTPGTVVGVPGGIPNRTVIYKNLVTDLGADPTGTTDVTATLNSAIASCPENQVIFVPAGIYKISGNGVNSAANKHNYTLRGAGTGATIFKPDSTFTHVPFHISTSDYPVPPATISVSSGATKGSSTVTVGDTSSFVVGGLMRIEASTNPTYVHPLYGANSPCFSFMFRVVAKTGTTVTFTPKLPIDLSTYSPKVAYYATAGLNACVHGVGYEDFTIDMDSVSTSTMPMFWEQAWGCWLRNIEVKNAAGKGGLYWSGVSSSEIRDCYFHDAKSVGSGAEGVDIASFCCWNLIENNIVYKTGGIVLNDAGGACSGNVIAYNYATFTRSYDSTVATFDIDIGHGGHNSFNLLEGNVAGGVTADGYYGSTSHCTFLRNWLTATHPTATNALRAVQLTHYNNYYNFVGNVLGTTTFPATNNAPLNGKMATGGWYDAPEQANYDNGSSSGAQVIYQLGFPSLGNTGYNGTIPATTPPDYTGVSYANPNAGSAFAWLLDLNVKGTLLRHGNYDYFNRGVVWDSSISDHTVPNSYYLTAKPSWWPGDLSWPSIGPDKTPVGGSIPAQVRFNSIRSIVAPAPPSALRLNGS